jgi:hypothetical protein
VVEADVVDIALPPPLAVENEHTSEDVVQRSE